MRKKISDSYISVSWPNVAQERGVGGGGEGGRGSYPQ